MSWINELEYWGFRGALRGMRNPMDSWDKGDSHITNGIVFIGPNDLKLMSKLIKAGPEHRKFLRMIHVQFDVSFPRYIWSEFDTYHFNTKNSCSTMHKLLSKKPITKDMFLYDKDEDSEVINAIVNRLEEIRLKYLETKNPNLIREAKQILPECFLQKRTVDTNYEELLTIYSQRKDHRLKEWREFCKELENLPYFNVIYEFKTN